MDRLHQERRGNRRSPGIYTGEDEGPRHNAAASQLQRRAAVTKTRPSMATSTQNRSSAETRRAPRAADSTDLAVAPAQSYESASSTDMDTRRQVVCIVFARKRHGWSS